MGITLNDPGMRKIASTFINFYLKEPWGLGFFFLYYFLGHDFRVAFSKSYSALSTEIYIFCNVPGIRISKVIASIWEGFVNGFSLPKYKAIWFLFLTCR